MSYPDFFPPDCPPSEAELRSMFIYRYTNNNPPKESDFQSAYELGKYLRSLSVQKYGISVNSCLDDARNAIGLVPALREYNFIAGGDASPEDGPLEYTPHKNISKHMTWYLFKNVNPYKKFSTIEKIL